MTGASAGRWDPAIRRVLRPPLRDPRFWLVQVVVIGLAAAHLIVDIISSPESSAFPSGLPVGLLLVPVGYAALRYGLSGSVATAMAQAKQQLDDATARAGAVHDGAERRLNLLISRHTETVRRLTEIRDVVTNLVSGEAARGSLEEEVARALGDQSPAGQAAAAPGADGRAAGRRASGITPGGTDGQPAEREREQSDPLGGDRHDTSRYQQADPGPLPVEASVLLSDEARHGGAGDQPRRSQASTSRSGAHVPERALDETAAGGRGLDV